MPSTAEATPLMKPEPNAVGSAVSSASRLNGAGSSRGSATAGRHLAARPVKPRFIAPVLVSGGTPVTQVIADSRRRKNPIASSGALHQPVVMQ